MKWDSGYSWDASLTFSIGWDWDDDSTTQYPGDGTGGYGGDIYAQKFVRHNMPACLLPGKAKLFVQCAYGSRRADIDILPGAGLQNTVEIGDIACGYTFANSFILYTDNDGEYWGLYLNETESVQIFPISYHCPRIGRTLRHGVNFSQAIQALDEERNQIESWALQGLYQAEDPVYLGGTFFDSSDYGSPYFYGWKPNWRGDTAYIVLVNKELTGPLVYAKRSRVLKFELTDSAVSRDPKESLEDYLQRRFTATFTIDSTSALWDFLERDGVYIPDGTTGQNYKAGHKECFPSGASSSGSFPVYCRYNGNDIIDIVYYEYDDSYSSDIDDTFHDCSAYGGNYPEYYCGCDTDYCEEDYSKTTRELGKFVVGATESGGVTTTNFSQDVQFARMGEGTYDTSGCSGWHANNSFYVGLYSCCTHEMYSGESPPTAQEARSQFASYCSGLGMFYALSQLWYRWKRGDRDVWRSEFDAVENAFAWLIVPWFNAEGFFLLDNTIVITSNLSVDIEHSENIGCGKQLGCYNGPFHTYLPASGSSPCGSTPITPYSAGNRPCTTQLAYIQNCFCNICGNTNCGCDCCINCTGPAPQCSEGTNYGYNYWADGAGRIQQPCNGCYCPAGNQYNEYDTVGHFYNEYAASWEGGLGLTDYSYEGCGLKWDRNVTWSGKNITRTAEQDSGKIGTIQWSADCTDDPADTDIVGGCSIRYAWGPWYEYYTVTTCGAAPDTSCPGIGVLESVSGNLNGYGTPNGSTKMYDGYDEYTDFASFVGWD